jgi:cyclopropane fatty-acyl-phospholipid synthase-like methyltransferase
MGPNALKMVEELTLNLNLLPGMRVLDLGCGKGLTSIFLAKEFGVQVFATDLWITATENYGRFKKVGLDNRIIPIHADANAMPYANEYFDAVISVDAYYYFGMNDTFMDEKLAPLIKTDGIIALAFPGFKKDINDCLPAEFLLSWTAEDLKTFHSCEWWSNLFSKSKKIHLQSVGELSCHDECWADWLATDNPYAVRDRPAMAAGAGNYMNLISVLATRKS